MTFDVFVKVPTVTATTVAGKIDSIALSWMAPSQTAGITTYLVEYSKDGNTWTTFTRPDSTVTNTTVTGLEAGTAYTFRVTPSIGASVSAAAATASNSATTNFQKVTNAIATPSTSIFSTVNLSWSAPTITTNLDNYQIEVSTDGTTWVVFERTASTATTASVTGLTFGTSYRFRITPSFSAALELTGQATTAAIITGSPTVSNVVASKVALSNTSLALNWNAPAMTSGLATYRVEVSTDGTTWSEFVRANSTVTSVTVTGLTPGTSYRFRVTPVFTGITPDSRFSATSAALTVNLYAIAYSQNVLQDAPDYYFRMNGALANSGSTALTLNSNLFLGTSTSIRSTGGVADGFISSTGYSNPGFRFRQATDFFSDSVVTVSGWVSATSGTAGGNIFHIANGYNFLRLYLTAEGRITADAGFNGNRVGGTVTGAPNANNLLDGKFHHFAWVSNGAIQSLYLDGALVGQGATYSIDFGGSEVNIARTLDYPGAKSPGTDIASPVVISRHYAAGRELLP
jgi:hypothetical protein